MTVNLFDWKKNWALIDTFFQAEEEQLRNRLRIFRPRHLFFCSFESRFAKSGGLAAVTVNSLPFLKETNQLESASLMSPFYPHIMDSRKLSNTGRTFRVNYGSRSVDVEILQFESSYCQPRPGSLSEYYLKADGFFEAKNRLNDPYLYVENNRLESDNALRSNALFFCRAVPFALAALGITENVILHIHEWQTALLSLTVKEAMLDGVLMSCGTVQTIHNPYDSFIPKADLKKIINAKTRKNRIDHMSGNGLTAFQIGLQFVDAPVVTVSENYSRELTEDILQTQYFAPHLQTIFRENSIFGINNGPFVGFSEKFPKRQLHTPAEINSIKQQARRSLLAILDSYNPPERFGSLKYQNGSILGLPEDVPIIVMSGRLDPVQKGYDILLQALERFQADEIKAVLTPMALQESDLDYFHEISAKCPGNVCIFPIRMKEGYLELQTGSTFGIMPSIYEPFGAAIEYMVNGTVNIARRSGGLVDQLIHGENGFLFLEKRTFYNIEQISSFVKMGEKVEARKNNKWAVDMAEALYLALRDAADIYRQHRDEYCRMILRGFAKAATFSWEKNAAEYWQVYQKISAV